MVLDKIDIILCNHIVNLCTPKRVHIYLCFSKSSIQKNHTASYSIRRLCIEDLISNQKSKIDFIGIPNLLKNKVILVTGAGGSVGQQLVEHIQQYNPKLLLCLDNTELFLYQLEETYKTKKIKYKTFLGSIQDYNLLQYIFASYKPSIIFHTAAYKHVPILEHNPISAIQNNIQGTWNLTSLASEHNSELFVFISTDKAVKPISIMGLSKRMGELICQYMHHNSKKTLFRTVRFGNIIESSGNVIQLFHQQVQMGGPITVTHPDMKRFFMSASEACQLILQASIIEQDCYGTFIPNIERSIKIVDIAYKIINLYGHIPEKDIQIIFTGLRPGDKLSEKLTHEQETTIATSYTEVYAVKTVHHLIPDFKQHIEELFKLPLDIKVEDVFNILQGLISKVESNT